MKSEIDFKLNVPFEYAVNGGVETASLLVLKAPSNKQRFQRAKLKEFFYVAFGESREESSDAKETTEPKDAVQAEPPTEEAFAEYVVQTLYTSSKVKMVEVIDEFKQLLLSEGICKVEGSVNLTQALYDKMDAEDSDRLLGEYIGAFILASFYAKITAR